jgi:Arc/MetJ-type ribon-helix-helix transcriptional regulator
MGVPRTKAKEKMVLISVHIPKQMIEEIHDLVMSGRYLSMSEFIRYAIRDLLNNMREYLANQVATTTNSQPQTQPQPQETHQAQQQQQHALVRQYSYAANTLDKENKYLRSLLQEVLNTDMKTVTNRPSIETVEYVIKKLITWAEMERKSEEVTKRYRECIAKLVDAILNNLDHLRFNTKQENGTYKISRKIIREFLEVDCGLPKGKVAASYYIITEEFGKRGFTIMRTPTAIILRKKQEVVRNVP